MKASSGLGSQGLSTRERIILLLAAAVAAVVLVTRGLPIANNVYAERAASLESVKLDIERELRLPKLASLPVRQTPLSRRVSSRYCRSTLPAPESRLILRVSPRR